MDLASKKNAADVPPPPEGSAERQSSNNDTSCDIIPGRDVNMVAGEAFQDQLEQPSEVDFLGNGAAAAAAAAMEARALQLRELVVHAASRQQQPHIRSCSSRLPGEH